MSADKAREKEQRRAEKEARRARRAAKRQRKLQKAERRESRRARKERKANSSSTLAPASRLHAEAAIGNAGEPLGALSVPRSKEANSSTAAAGAKRSGSVTESGADRHTGKKRRLEAERASNDSAHVTDSTVTGAIATSNLSAPLADLSKQQLKIMAAELVERFLSEQLSKGIRKEHIIPEQVDKARLTLGSKANESKRERKQHDKLAAYVEKRLEKTVRKRETGVAARAQLAPASSSAMLSSSSIPIPATRATPAAPASRVPFAANSSSAGISGRSIGAGISSYGAGSGMGSTIADKRWASAGPIQKAEVDQRENKEALIAANMDCSHVDMLEKLYMPKQFKWLKEAYGLEWKSSHFSKAEDAMIEQGAEEFARNNDMTVDNVKGLFLDRPTAEHARLYASLTSYLVRKLGDRPARNLRIHCSAMWNPDRVIKGTWKVQEVEGLMQAYDRHGPRWERIGNELNRPGHACRSRYAFELGKRTAEKGKWSEEECLRLLQTVEDQCEKRGIQPAEILKGDQRFSWLAVEKGVKSRTAQMCRDKWETIFCRSERAKRGQPIRWIRARDDFLLMGMLKTQTQAIDENDDILIHWRDFQKEDWCWDVASMQRRWAALRQRHAPDEATMKDLYSTEARSYGSQRVA
ncbi:RNA polymerase I termination factor, Myb superfamily [Ceraceosorus bombacis]|uniref:RNA polymerase I termination factor, Myb superfamily n=1 Tax=Ceraceosorus bombacis TaxID=401625 RepID=A0A0P1B7Q8_9BASI|nr:RNA polymerase I termination factor, Myb superfamily [Ceraceosorus bombacis]